MSTPFPILVIGRGIAGLAVAFELLKHRKKAVVIGPASLERTASAAAVGLSSLKGQYHASKPLFAAKVDGHKHLWPWLAEIEAISGLTIPRFQSCSHEPYWSLMEYERIRERVFHRTFSGHTGARFSNPDEAVQALFSQPFLGHAIYDGDLWFDPRKCLEALEVAIVKLGGLLIDETVARIVKDGEAVRAEGVENSFKSEHLILAAGIYSDTILNNSGILAPKQRAVFGETLVTDKFSQGSPHIVHMGQKHLIRHQGGWSYGSSSINIESFDGSDFESAEPALQQDSRLTAGLLSNRFSTRYTGIRGRYPDIAPGMGELKLPDSKAKIMIFSGFYKNGLQLAPFFAEKLARYYGSSSAFLCESQFSIARFS